MHHQVSLKSSHRKFPIGDMLLELLAQKHQPREVESFLVRREEFSSLRGLDFRRLLVTERGGLNTRNIRRFLRLSEGFLPFCWRDFLARRTA